MASDTAARRCRIVWCSRPAADGSDYCICGPCSVNDHMGCQGCRCDYCADLRGAATAAPVTLRGRIHIEPPGDYRLTAQEWDDMTDGPTTTTP